jgi:hypothetical protein
MLGLAESVRDPAASEELRSTGVIPRRCVCGVDCGFAPLSLLAPGAGLLDLRDRWRDRSGGVSVCGAPGSVRERARGFVQLAIAEREALDRIATATGIEAFRVRRSQLLLALGGRCTDRRADIALRAGGGELTQ